MQPVLSNFLAPSATTPLRWASNSKNRSVREQVISGLQLALGFVAMVIVLAAAIASISALFIGAPQSARLTPSLAWILLTAATLIMFISTHHWARFFSPLFCMLGFRAAVALLLGFIPLSSLIPRRLTRPEALLVFLACGLAIALAWRFASAHPPRTTILDRLSLTYFLLVFFLQLTVGAAWTLFILLSALAGLTSAWCFHRSPTRKNE